MAKEALFLNWNNLDFFFLLTQVQAGEAEKQIKAEFERLHAVLTREEALCLDALASDETKKIEALQSCMDSLEKDIKKLEELMEGLKKDMQMENLPLLKVRTLISSPLKDSMIIFDTSAAANSTFYLFITNCNHFSFYFAGF